MTNKIIILFVMLHYGLLTFGQDCATRSIPLVYNNDVDFPLRKNQSEQDLLDFISSGEYARLLTLYSNGSLRTTTAGAVISIPIVFHIVGDNANINLTDNEVSSQVDILNYFYRHVQGSPGDGAGVDTRIEFCLATKDPEGNSSNGINRIPGNYGPYNVDVDADDHNLKSLIDWNPHFYLNVWVTELIANVGTINGYSFFPNAFLNDPLLFYRDGVVIDYRVCGLNGNRPTRDKGVTLVHEIGHWLNLSHTWGDDNNAVCGDDYVDDTPVCSGPLWTPFFQNECTSISSCILENANQGLTDIRQIANVMDYSDDLCRNMFTEHQKQRMLSTIFTVRSGLFSSDGGCNEPPVHCSNGIQDEDEVGVDCGGTCPACNSSGGYWVGCSIGDHYSPIVSCYPRQNYLNIYGCLNGATNGPSRVMYSDNYNIGTPSFHFTSGRVTIYADCNEHNSCSTCGDAMPHSGSIHLVNGFKFMANSLANEIRFIITDLAERSIEPNAMICPPSTSDPCPSNQHYKIGPDNSINYSTKTYTTSSENKILTYPNPVHGLLSVDLNSNQETIWELCDGTNRIILVGKSVSDFTIDFYLLETGVYFLKVFNNDEIYLERIIHY